MASLTKLNGKFISKGSDMIEAIGCLDEALASLYTLMAHPPIKIDTVMTTIEILENYGGYLNGKEIEDIEGELEVVKDLRDTCDEAMKKIPKGFLRFGTPSAAMLNEVRVRIRRLERILCKIDNVEPVILEGLNVLSMFIFIAATHTLIEELEVASDSK